MTSKLLIIYEVISYFLVVDKVDRAWTRTG